MEHTFEIVKGVFSLMLYAVQAVSVFSIPILCLFSFFVLQLPMDRKRLFFFLAFYVALTVFLYWYGNQPEPPRNHMSIGDGMEFAIIFAKWNVISVPVGFITRAVTLALSAKTSPGIRLPIQLPASRRVKICITVAGMLALGALAFMSPFDLPKDASEPEKAAYRKNLFYTPKKPLFPRQD